MPIENLTNFVFRNEFNRRKYVFIFLRTHSIVRARNSIHIHLYIKATRRNDKRLLCRVSYSALQTHLYTRHNITVIRNNFLRRIYSFRMCRSRRCCRDVPKSLACTGRFISQMLHGALYLFALFLALRRSPYIFATNATHSYGHRDERNQ